MDRDYVAKYGDAKKSKVMVSCPHCGHLTHVDVPTDRKGRFAVHVMWCSFIPGLRTKKIAKKSMFDLE